MDTTAATPTTGDTGAPPAEAKNTEERTVPYARFKEVNDTLNELRQWKAEQEKVQEKARKEAEKAEAERLKKGQEWEQLAEQRQQRIDELEPIKERAERYEAALKKRLATEREGLPKHIIALLDRLDPAEQLEWLADNHEAISKPTAPNTNAGERGGPTTRKATTDDIAAIKRQQYGGF